MNSEIVPRSVFISSGDPEQATYRDALIPDYRYNPVIEALPDILDEDSAMAQLLAGQPKFDPESRQAPANLRFHMVQSALQFFVPLDAHLELEQKFSVMLRTGYLARNPVNANQWHELHRRADLVGRDIPTRPDFRAMTNGFFIFGISGGGKTTAVEKILKLYPQIIDHREYRGLRFTSRQLVYLKLDCPHDGSIRGLCINFFQAVDDLLQTRYYEAYASGRRTTDEMIPHMARVASLHHIGVLVIDEIQHLSGAKSGGADQMLSFFVRLINTIGLPVVLIGTYKAIGLLKGEFRQARRGSGQGDVVWERMKDDETWWHFLETLFKYQYVRHPVTLTPEMAGTLFEISQGITDFAIKVFMLGQTRAIGSGKETLTKGIFNSVAADSLRLAMPVLTALRTNNLADLSMVPDVLPIDFEKEFKKQREEIRAGRKWTPDRKALADAVPSVSADSLPTQVEASPAANSVSDSLLAGSKPVGNVEKRTNRKVGRSARPTGGAGREDGLVAVVEAGRKKGLGPHAALAQAGFIPPASEFLAA